MATVRFSEELKHKIKSNAEKIYEDKDIKLKNDFMASRNFGEELYQLTFSNTLDSQPDWCFEKAEDCTFEGFYNLPDSMTREQKYLYEGLSLTYKYPTKHAIPRDGKATGFKADKKCRLSGYGTWSLDYESSKWDSIKKDVMVYTQQRSQIWAEGEEFVDGVMAVVNAHATLAPAVKAWSGLWELVPEEYEERAKRVVPKKERQVVTRDGADVDLNKLTGVVVASKLTK